MENTVKLVGFYGSDETHACSAWTSTNSELTPDKRNRIGKFLKELASNGHHTPFEKSMLHFICTTDIATHIHILKHRIGVSLNSESARYKELKEDKYYLPVDWPEHMIKELEESTKQAFEKYHAAIDELVKAGFTRKRAKESARFYLPHNHQYTIDLSFNFRSFMHFQGLRNSDGAQLEVKNLAQEMLSLVKETNQFNLSLEAFDYK